MRKEYCPNCFKSVYGLYQNKKIKDKRTLILKAFYCDNCNLVLLNNQVCFKVISYKVKSE